MSNPNISDLFRSPTTDYTPAATAIDKKDTVIGPKTGVSTIQESEQAAEAQVPVTSFPILPVPRDDGQSFSKAVNSVQAGNSGEALGVGSLLTIYQQASNEIINDMLDAWAKNLRIIEDEKKKWVESPQYQILLDTTRFGDLSPQTIAGVQSMAGGAVNAANGAPTMISLVDRLQEVISRSRQPADGASTTSISAAPTPADNQMIVFPMVAAMMIMGGGLVLGSTEMSMSLTGLSSSPVSGTVEIISHLQPVIPSALVPDVMMMVNLMVMPIIYYSAIEGAISNIKEKQPAVNLKTAENFAQDIRKLVNDPVRIQSMIVTHLHESTSLPAERREELVAMIKLILTMTALSLIYIVEAGKITPEEMLGMLNGEIPIPDDNIKYKLIEMIRVQLQSFLPGEKAKILESFFEYLDGKPNLENMLDPGKVLHEVLQTSPFTQETPPGGLETSPA